MQSLTSLWGSLQDFNLQSGLRIVIPAGAGSGSFDEESEEERCALQRAVSAILAQRPAERDEGYLHSAAQIAASIASRDMFAVAGRIPEARHPSLPIDFRGQPLLWGAWESPVLACHRQPKTPPALT